MSELEHRKPDAVADAVRGLDGIDERADLPHLVGVEPGQDVGGRHRTTLVRPVGAHRLRA